MSDYEKYPKSDLIKMSILNDKIIEKYKSIVEDYKNQIEHYKEALEHSKNIESILQHQINLRRF